MVFGSQFGEKKKKRKKLKNKKFLMTKLSSTALLLYAGNIVYEKNEEGNDY